MERNPWGRALIILGVIAVALYLGGELWRLALHFGSVIVLFFLAWLLAFILLPLVRLFERRISVSHAVAAGVVYLGLLVVLVTFLVLVIPLLVEQVSQLAQQLPSLAARIPALTVDVQSWLDRRGVPVTLDLGQPQPAFSQQATQLGTLLVQNSVAVASGVASGIFGFTIVLILSFYVVLDGDRFVNSVLAGIPTHYQDDTVLLLTSIERTFGGFLWGTVLQAGLLGLGTAVIMTVSGLSYVLLASIFCAIVMVIPFIGPFLALVVPLLIAVFNNLPLSQLLLLLLALSVLQFLVLNVVAPKVLSQRVGLHPLVVFLALLVGVKEAGLAGAVFAVPVAAVVYATARIILNRWSVIEPATSPPSDETASAAAFPEGVLVPSHVLRIERFGPNLGRLISRVFQAWSN